MFQLDAPEKAEVVTNCDHLSKLKFSKALPFAFTEYGAVALTNVLASAQAVEMGIYVVQAFVQLRQASSVHADLAKRLTELELSHDTSSRNTRNQLHQVFEALRELADKVTPPEPPPSKRPIGFLPLEHDKPKGSNAKGSQMPHKCHKCHKCQANAKGSGLEMPRGQVLPFAIPYSEPANITARCADTIRLTRDTDKPNWRAISDRLICDA